ncbi:MAG: hypothetical protein V1754_08535 [Pseudomonadota bacterium]
MSFYVEAGVCAMLLLFNGCASTKEEQPMPPPDVTFSSKEEQLEQFRVATGDKLERLCTMLSKPMHCPAPGIFDKENAILIERLPKLTPKDRKTALAVLSTTIDIKEIGQRTLPVLEQLWKTANTAERNDLVPALVKSMVRAEVFSNARLVFEHLNVEGFSDFQNFHVLRWLLEKSTPEKEIADVLQKVLIDKIKNGKIPVNGLEDALGCAIQLKSDDPQIPLLFRVVNGVNKTDAEDNIEAIKKLTATAHNQGVAFAFLIMCSNGNEEVNGLAHSALDRVTTALGMQLDADAFYLDALRKKGTRDWLGEQNPERESAIRYFKAEARRNAKMTAKRLKEKNMIFSDEELKLFRACEISSIFIDAFER